MRPAKVRSLGRKNFFRENFRHAFWSVAIDNKLSINEKLYNLLCVEVDGDRPTPPSSII